MSTENGPVRIFIGCSSNNEDLEAMAVLGYTLQKRSSLPLEIVWMKLDSNRGSFWFSDPEKGEGWNTRGWATPFSAFRWAVPEYCGFKGRAIYLDVDMIAMADIAELWRQAIEGEAVLLAKKQGIRFCTTLFDCEKVRPHLPPVSEQRAQARRYARVRDFFAQNPNLVGQFEGNWNCLDGELYADMRDPDIKIHHYTSVPCQVHLKHAKARLEREGGRHWYQGPANAHPRPDLQALFDELLAEATAAGFGIERFRSASVFGEYSRGGVKNQMTA